MSQSSVIEPSGDGFSEGVLLAPRILSLDDLKRPVERELEAFKRYFRESLRSPVGLVDVVTQYILRQKGKRIRPILVLLAAKTCGAVTESSYRAAALVELLHTATLVHDDVVDEADRRRGVFSINALWKNKVAVLFGDFLLSRGLLLALDYHEYGLLHTMSDAVKRMSEGELLQIQKSRMLDIDEETYFRIISDKTASLISACTVSGALSATSDGAAVERMRTIGEKMGLAFQIRDDLFDFGVEDVGKPLGIDLQEKKMTLPLIYALRESPKAEQRRILKIVKQKRKSRADVREVSRFVEAAGGTDYARRTMNTLAQEARSLLSWFPASDAREALIGLIDYTINRSK